MPQTGERIVGTAIYDITFVCFTSFERLTTLYNETIAKDSSGDDDAPYDFLGLRNRLYLWIRDTNALSLMESSLDARLSKLPLWMSSIPKDLLELISRSLARSKLPILTSLRCIRLNAKQTTFC